MVASEVEDRQCQESSRASVVMTAMTELIKKSTEHPMTLYVNSYVKMMHKKHPQGEKFKMIEALMKSDAKTKVVTDMHPIARFFFSPNTSSAYGSSRSRKEAKENSKNNIEEAKKQLGDLLMRIDKSEDSQWLAQYLIDTAPSSCSEIVEMLEKYLAACKR